MLTCERNCRVIEFFEAVKADLWFFWLFYGKFWKFMVFYVIFLVAWYAKEFIESYENNQPKKVHISKQHVAIYCGIFKFLFLCTFDWISSIVCFREVFVLVDSVFLDFYFGGYWFLWSWESGLERIWLIDLKIVLFGEDYGIN